MIPLPSDFGVSQCGCNKKTIEDRHYLVASNTTGSTARGIFPFNFANSNWPIGVVGMPPGIKTISNRESFGGSSLRVWFAHLCSIINLKVFYAVLSLRSISFDFFVNSKRTLLFTLFIFIAKHLYENINPDIYLYFCENTLPVCF